MKKLRFGLFAIALMAAGLMPLKAQNLHYSTGFEDQNDLTDWVLLNGSMTNKWCIGTAASNGGSHGLYVSNDNGTTNAYTISSTGVVYAYHEFTLTGNGCDIMFDWRCHGEGSYDYIRVFVIPSTVTPSAGTWPGSSTSSYEFGSAAAPSGWVDVVNGKLNLQDNWQHFMTSLTLNPGTYRLLFVWSNDGSVGTMPGGGIDNVVIDEPVCPTPTRLSFSNITVDSCIVSWYERGSASSWILEYADSVFTPGTGQGQLEYVYDTFFVLEYLDTNTTYYVYVHSDCGGDTSFNVSGSFRTACGTAQLPLTENFDSWSTGSSSAIDPCWQRGTNYSTTSFYPYTSATYAHSGGNSMYLYSTSSSWSYIALPYVDAQASSLMLSFWLYKSNTSYTHAFEVGVMTNPEDVNTFTRVQTVTPQSSSTWEYVEVPLNTYTGNGHYVALLSPNGSYSYPYIDDIELDYIPTCIKPTNLAFSNITADSCIVTWHDRSGASMWVVEYADSAFLPGCGQGTVEYVYDTMLVLEYLNGSTEYHVYVHADCGGDTSRNVYGTFRTACTSAQLPVTENFNVWPTGSSSSYITPCWHRASSYSTTNYYPYTSTSYAHRGDRSLYLYSTSSSYTYIN